MSLTSQIYFAFIALFLLIFYKAKTKQWIVLLAASIIFYFLVGEPYTVIYLIAGVLVTWFASNKICDSQEKGNEKSAKKWLTLALVTDIGILAALKYLNFLLFNAGSIYSLITNTDTSWKVNWPASLGISFYTLQIVSYLLDCYWGISKPQKNIGKFALFSCFFPQMVSGPISRYNQLGDELFKEHIFSTDNIRDGSFRIIIGVIKKVGMAGCLSQIASEILDSTGNPNFFISLLGIFVYVFQIYADFDGCMDIVIGTAKCFDIDMIENFNHPFKSKSIQEFWQRWHITLGLWLRDYIMYPLLHSKNWRKLTKYLKKKKCSKRFVKLFPTHLAMLILWICMGLWHGGGWNFILEGVWFWLIIVISEWLNPQFEKIRKKINTENKLWIFFQQIRTGIIYAVGAIMFRCDTYEKMVILSDNLFSKSVIISLKSVVSDLKPVFISSSSSVFSLLVISTVLVVISILNRFGGISKLLKGKPIMFQILIALVLIYIIIIAGTYGPGYDASEFIYGGF